MRKHFPLRSKRLLSESVLLSSTGSSVGIERQWGNILREQLERMVREASKALEAKGVCRLWKIPNDLRLTGGSGLTFGSQTPCDFFGHDSSGRIVMIECKDIKGHRLPMSPAGLKPHQRTALEDCAKTSGAAILIWKHGNRVVALSPWEIADYTRNRRSISWKAVEKLSRPFTRDEIVSLIQESLRR